MVSSRSRDHFETKMVSIPFSRPVSTPKCHTLHTHTYFYIANPDTYLQIQTNIKMNNTNTIVHPIVCCKTTAVTLRPGTRQFEGMCYVRLGIIMLYLNICKQSHYKWQNNHLLIHTTGLEILQHTSPKPQIWTWMLKFIRKSHKGWAKSECFGSDLGEVAILLKLAKNYSITANK